MRFSRLSWTRDSKGFFYSRYPEPPTNKVLEAALSGQALYYHRVGTPQSEDVLVYERPDLAQWLIAGQVTEDGRYLLPRAIYDDFKALNEVISCVGPAAWNQWDETSKLYWKSCVPRMRMLLEQSKVIEEK